jgi:hypothetical protein
MSHPDNPQYGLEPHRATTILVLGILSLVVCQPLGIAAWLMGSADLQKMKAGLMDPSGEGQTQAGYVMGIISVVLMVISLLMICVTFAFIGLTAGVAAGIPNQP